MVIVSLVFQYQFSEEFGYVSPFHAAFPLKTIHIKILDVFLPSVQDHDAAVTGARAHLGTYLDTRRSTSQ